MEPVRDAASKEILRSWDESRPRLSRDQLRSKPSSSPLAAAKAVAPGFRRFRLAGSDRQSISATLPSTNSRLGRAVRCKSLLLRNSSPSLERKFLTLHCGRRARPPAQDAFPQQPLREHRPQLRREFQQLSCCRRECLRASDLGNRTKILALRRIWDGNPRCHHPSANHPYSKNCIS